MKKNKKKIQFSSFSKHTHGQDKSNEKKWDTTRLKSNQKKIDQNESFQ